MLENAQMITADAPRGTAVVLSTVVQLRHPATEVAGARLLSTAHGVYEARLGGRPVSDAVLAPGWTSYEWRLQVQEHDVRALLTDGVELEVLLGNGWWRGELGFASADVDYGNQIGFLGELQVTYTDGSVQSLPTDDT